MRQYPLHCKQFNLCPKNWFWWWFHLARKPHWGLVLKLLYLFHLLRAMQTFYFVCTEQSFSPWLSRSEALFGCKGFELNCPKPLHLPLERRGASMEIHIATMAGFHKNGSKEPFLWNRAVTARANKPQRGLFSRHYFRQIQNHISQKCTIPLWHFCRRGIVWKRIGWEEELSFRKQKIQVGLRWPQPLRGLSYPLD